RETRADVRARQHPFAASTRDLRAALKDSSPQIGDLLRRGAQESAITLLLPSTRTAPQPSLEILRDENATSGTLRVTLAAWQVDALTIAPQDALDLLASLPSDDALPHALKIGADLRYWQIVAKFALELIARQHFKPILQKEDDKFIARWEPLFDEPSEQERLTRLVRAMPPICRALFCDEKDAKRDAPAPRDLLADFLATTIDAFARENLDWGRYLPDARKSIAEAWLDALGTETGVVAESSATLSAFYEQYRAWAEPVGAAGSDTFRICFRLDPPETTNEEGIVTPKAHARDWSLRYLLQANDDPSLLVPADAVWRERGSALKFLNRKFDAPQERLLAGLGLASKMFPPIETSLRAARPESCALNVEQAYAFIREATLLLQSSGFGVLVPGISSKLGVRVNLKSKKQSPQHASRGGVASLTFESVIQYDWQLALGGEPLSREEFERLASLKVPLVQVRGQWVEIHPDQIEQAIKFWEKQKDGELSLQDALRLALSQEPTKANIGLPVTDVAAEGWIADLLEQLARGEKLAPISAPDSFHGTLRHYQSAGLSWLAFLRQWGLGACLADDMGLGKTPTTIALLLAERAQRKKTKPALVICPTSVVSNWERELARFAPDLRVHAHHGAARQKDDFAAQAKKHDVVLSSYALLHRDLAALTQVEWSDVILDEAQNIKNPTTKQAQAARKIGEKAEWRATLTGTPVENRLTELWSIFQFLNPDYLGSQNDFYNRFAKPIERTSDADATKRLK
ncbi:MAG: DEAD/DEAH box helicase, partial [Chloroflexota bacterium]